MARYGWWGYKDRPYRVTRSIFGLGGELTFEDVFGCSGNENLFFDGAIEDVCVD